MPKTLHITMLMKHHRSCDAIRERSIRYLSRDVWSDVQVGLYLGENIADMKTALFRAIGQRLR